MVVTRGRSSPRAATSVHSSTPWLHLPNSRKASVRRACASLFSHNLQESPLHCTLPLTAVHSSTSRLRCKPDRSLQSRMWLLDSLATFL